VSRFLVDAQLPPMLARRLVLDGHDTVRVLDIGFERASDRAIWDRANIDARAFVTKDDDFARRRRSRRDGPTIVWIRHPSCGRDEIIGLVVAALPRLADAIAAGVPVVELG
jgi:predicted nuclease of predicted toxin-antitoxin system